MTTDEPIAIYDSQGERYKDAFATFLANTDQKTKAREFIERVLENVPRREVFVDAGAGTGALTTWLAPHFQRNWAIEPSPFLGRQLAENCPHVRIVDRPILEAEIPAPADFVVCSHVFYYVPSTLWLANLEKLAAWLAPGGTLLVVLQNAETDCMKLLTRFHGRHFDLRPLADRFADRHGVRFSVEVHSVACSTWGADLTTVLIIAEFMLNLLPMREAPSRREVTRFLEDFRSNEGYRLSCTQDVLMIRAHA